MQQPHSTQIGGRVLLIGGNSGAGKTVMGEALASLFDRSLLLVDDFRMVVQEMTTLAEQPGIHYFLAHPTIWQKPPEALCEGFIAVGNALLRPLSVVIAHHIFVGSAGPIILEGDGILPALAAQHSFVNKHFTSAPVTNEVRSIFLIESDEEIILRNMRQSRRGFESLTLREQEIQVHASWLYGQWLRRQAEYYGLPAIESRPWETSVERVLHALES